QLGAGLELHAGEINLVELAQRVASDQQQTTERHQIRVETTSAAVIGTWDAVRLARALDNLVSNAVKYSPAGGEVLIRVSVSEAEGSAVVSVQDHGEGIPAEDLPRIFDRFGRARNVQGRIRGSGIGLASARQVIEQHGGTIGV